jgi:hypothetical protein
VQQSSLVPLAALVTDVDGVTSVERGESGDGGDGGGGGGAEHLANTATAIGTAVSTIVLIDTKMPTTTSVARVTTRRIITMIISRIIGRKITRRLTSAVAPPALLTPLLLHQPTPLEQPLCGRLRMPKALERLLAPFVREAHRSELLRLFPQRLGRAHRRLLPTARGRVTREQELEGPRG